MRTYTFRVFEGVSPMLHLRLRVSDKFMNEYELGKFDDDEFIKSVGDMIVEKYGKTLEGKLKVVGAISGNY